MHTSCHAGGPPIFLDWSFEHQFNSSSRTFSANIRFGEHTLKTSSRRLQDVFIIFLSSKTSWRCLEDIIARRLANTSWRHLGRRKALRWRRLEVLKTSWKTRNVCWVKWRNRQMGFANVRSENTVMSNNNRWNYKIENLHTVVAYCCIIATTRKWDHVSLFLESR